MRSLAIGIVAALTLAGQATAQATQFDLICRGTTQIDGDRLVPESRPFDTRFRFDLIRNIWCMAECEYVNAFERVNEAEYVLVDYKSVDGFKDYREINRVSGAYVSHLETRQTGALILIMDRGECERAEFSGIAAQRF